MECGEVGLDRRVLGQGSSDGVEARRVASGLEGVHVALGSAGAGSASTSGHGDFLSASVVLGVAGGRCATAMWGEGCGVAAAQWLLAGAAGPPPSRRLPTASHLPGRLHRRLMYVRIERIFCTGKGLMAGGSLRDGFVGGTWAGSPRRVGRTGDGCGEGTPPRPVDSRLRGNDEGGAGMTGRCAVAGATALWGEGWGRCGGWGGREDGGLAQRGGLTESGYSDS